MEYETQVAVAVLPMWFSKWQLWQGSAALSQQLQLFPQACRGNLRLVYPTLAERLVCRHRSWDSAPYFASTWALLCLLATLCRHKLGPLEAAVVAAILPACDPNLR